ncbi:MAG: thiamine-phosphate pyrophosphorylase [Candidatus Omnitrophica bacterium]|nr:thiamine-phosphate pyrophosphorylase [Candidatus Omnitrophota bacterium]
MVKVKTADPIIRVIDANLNRAKEGLRVCEDICRFILDSKPLSRQCKDLRHQLNAVVEKLGPAALVNSRDIENDVGKPSTTTEMARSKVADIFYANCQRVKESVRVLEEFFKLVDKKLAEDLKKIRYQVYAVEKKVVERI